MQVHELHAFNYLSDHILCLVLTQPEETFSLRWCGNFTRLAREVLLHELFKVTLVTVVCD